MTKQLARLIYTNRNTANTDSVSLQSVVKRFREFFENLPEPTSEMIKKGREYQEVEEARRLKHRVERMS